MSELSANLREVEERLTRKGQRLTQIELELAESRAERAAVEERASLLATELTATRAGLSAAEEQLASLREKAQAEAAELRRAAEARAAEIQRTVESRDAAQRTFEAQLAEHDSALALAQKDVRGLEGRVKGYLEVLSSLEGQRSIFDSEIAELSARLYEREASAARVQRELNIHATRARELASDLAARDRRVGTLEREVNALSAALAQRNDQLANAERAQLKLHESVAGLTESLASRSERVIALETATARQSESFGAQQHEIDRLRRERDALQSQTIALEVELATARTRNTEQEEAARIAAASRAGLEAQLGIDKQRGDELAGELTGVRRHLEERTTALRTALDERTATLTAQIADLTRKLTAADARARVLEDDIADQVESLRVTKEELRGALARTQELESDRHAAEDTINRIEAELRTKTVRLEELTRTSEEWRSIVEEAKQSLAQRDTFIRRLEAEAAQSAMLLGNIQQSIKRMEPAGNTGNHEMVPEGAVRLLIRADGDAEVVHVLSRKTTIGRTAENDLQIETKYISRHHAVILAGPNYTIIEDLNSTNGVLVNNRRVTRHTLKDGDNVIIGRTQFRFAVRASRAA